VVVAALDVLVEEPSGDRRVDDAGGPQRVSR
jgi:hypothetical protein